MTIEREPWKLPECMSFIMPDDTYAAYGFGAGTLMHVAPERQPVEEAGTLWARAFEPLPEVADRYNPIFALVGVLEERENHSGWFVLKGPYGNNGELFGLQGAWDTNSGEEPPRLTRVYLDVDDWIRRADEAAAPCTVMIGVEDGKRAMYREMNGPGIGVEPSGPDFVAILDRLIEMGRFVEVPYVKTTRHKGRAA